MSTLTETQLIRYYLKSLGIRTEHLLSFQYYEDYLGFEELEFQCICLYDNKSLDDLECIGMPLDTSAKRAMKVFNVCFVVVSGAKSVVLGTR